MLLENLNIFALRSAHIDVEQHNENVDKPLEFRRSIENILVDTKKWHDNIK